VFGVFLVVVAVRLVTSHGALTVLALPVIAILSVDVLFALDSVPAILGITQSTYLALCANTFALLVGLRPLYFLLVGLRDRLVHLHYGLAVVLGFIGVRLTRPLAGNRPMIGRWRSRGTGRHRECRPVRRPYRATAGLAGTSTDVAPRGLVTTGSTNATAAMTAIVVNARV
jgi:hypothetical protein